jgi:hypothetical protein
LSFEQHIFIIHTILYISVNSEDTLIKRQVHLRRVLNEPTSFDSRCLSWGISGLKAAKRSKNDKYYYISELRRSNHGYKWYIWSTQNKKIYWIITIFLNYTSYVIGNYDDIWFLLLQWASAIKLQLNLYIINSLKIKTITISVKIKVYFVHCEVKDPWFNNYEMTCQPEIQRSNRNQMSPHWHIILILSQPVFALSL